MKVYGVDFKTEEQAREFVRLYEQNPPIVDEAIRIKQTETFDGCVMVGKIIGAAVVAGLIIGKLIFRK